MEINEKLELFHEAVLEAAGAQSESILEEYKKSYQESLAAYEKKKIREQETSEGIAEAKIRKEWNRQISEQALIQKKRYHEAAEAKKTILFAEAEKKLKEYQQTKEYKEYLAAKILDAKKFARGEQVVIYLNPTEAGWKEELEEKTGCELTVSSMDFTGGIRAVIRSKNVLIDESFSSRLEQVRAEYSF